MKLVTDDEVIMGTAAAEENAFTIKASSKAFKVLSSNLYKNKIRAIIRELACNCVDAHFLNNNQKTPFEIKAPTRLDPRFVIRDFGPGLSHDNMIHMYTTFFESTKNGSNDFIGALGLGSKSPLSYTNNFTVVSYFEGRARGYTVLIDKGQPTIRSIFDEEMTEDEMTGLEITVPVKIDDISSWEYEIKYVVRPFVNPKPKISGINSNEISWFEDSDKEFFTGESQKHYYENSGLYALYGKIVYPLNDVPNIHDNCAWLSNKHNVVYINFELGELDITPSREELSLDPNTVSNIISKVKKINDELMQYDINELNSIEFTRQLCRKINTMKINLTRSLEKNNVLIKNKPISYYNNYAQDEIESIKETLIKNNVYVYEIDTNSPSRKKINDRNFYRAGHVPINSLIGVNVKSLDILIDDKKGKKISSIKALSLDGKSKHDSVIVLDESKESLEIIKSLKSIMEGDTVNVYKSSEMDDLRKKLPNYEVSKNKVRPKSSNVQRLYKDKYGQFQSESLYLYAEEIRNLTGYAICRSRDEIETYPEKTFWSCASILSIRQISDIIGIDEFYVIRAPALKYAKQSKLKSLSDKIIKSYIALIDEVNYDDYVSFYNYTSYVLNNIIKNKNLNHLLSEFVASSVVKDDAIKLSKIGQYLCNTSANDELALCNKIYNKLSKNAVETYKKCLHKFNENYPTIYWALSNYTVSNDVINDINKIYKLTKVK